MKINRYTPHIIVLPEDRANEEIANGFIQAPKVNYNIIQVERPAGGWTKVLEKLTKDHVPELRIYSQRMIVLLIDFDKRDDRLSYVENQIPKELKNRVFVLGVQSNPETLKRDINKTFEDIGDALAKDCYDKNNELWGHDLLKHNKTELDRMILSFRAYNLDIF